MQRHTGKLYLCGLSRQKINTKMWLAKEIELGWGCSSKVECLWVQSPVPQTNKQTRQKNPQIFNSFFFLVLGIEPGGILPLSYTPSPILFLIWKQGLARLTKVSLIAEAGLKPVILLSQLPKYWDYRCVPPCPAGLFLFFVLWYWG